MICFKSRGALFGEVWFDEEPAAAPGVDVVSYRQVSAPVRGARCRPFQTLVTDISADPDSILRQFGSNCQQKINRARRRDRLQLELITEPASLLDEFRAYYDGFARQKALRPLDHRWLVAACGAGQLALVSALQDGERLVWHGYLVRGRFAWLQYSASAFRGEDSAYRSLIGRANRWLHWQCMLRFREVGVATYDWGGVFAEERTAEEAGLNRFKREFRGREVRRFDCILPLTAKGRLRILVHRLADRCRALYRALGMPVVERVLPRGVKFLIGR
jgi:hypothetical protein